MTSAFCQKNSTEEHPARLWQGRQKLFRNPLFRLALACCLLYGNLAIDGQAQTAGEYQLKAAILYNFTKFVEWPALTGSPNDAPFVVGVLGEDPFGITLDQTLNGKLLNGRPFTLKRLKWGQNLRDCAILFISTSERKRLPQVLDSLKGSSVLTVSDLSNFCQQGGIISLVLEDKKVRFVVNIDMAEQARLRISSKLLTLAKAVLGERRQGGN